MPSERPTAAKFPFDIDVVMADIEAAIEAYAPAALFGLADEGYATPFEQLLACIISIRTLDETTTAVARRLLPRRAPRQK